MMSGGQGGAAGGAENAAAALERVVGNSEAATPSGPAGALPPLDRMANISMNAQALLSNINGMNRLPE